MGDSFKKKCQRLIAVILSVIVFIATFPLLGGVNAAEEWQKPAQDTTYEYNFATSTGIDLTSYTSDNKIDTVWSSDSLLKINGEGTMYYHDSTHGLAVYDGNSFETIVAGNAIITFDLCQYSDDTGVITVTDSVYNSELSDNTIDLKVSSDGEQMEFRYSGDSTVLTFTITSSGESYLHGITVENTSEDLDITSWVEKDFSIKIGDATLDITGAVSQSDSASASIDTGIIYYALSESAFVSIDLGGATLTTALLKNLSSDVVDSLKVNDDGEIIATFVDQSTYPYEYIIKVQDTSNFVTPGATDVYSFNFGAGAVPSDFSKSTPIRDYYTTDNGILTIANGSAASSPYWHDSSHGMAVYNGNYFDVKVAGDADIVFNICQYGKGGTLAATSLASGGEGSFDSNVFKSDTDGAAITYTYNGDAATLRFTLTSEGESYLHAITVKNTGEIESSPVANEQTLMPYEIDINDTLEVIPVGHRLYVGQSDTEANIASLDNVGYYAFDGRTDATTIEADIKITAVGSSSSNGVFFGMLEDVDNISMIASIGMRGDSRIRNVYNKSSSPLSATAGSMDKNYNVGDIIHLVNIKDDTGWHSEATVDSEKTSVLIEYSKIAMFDDIESSVKYGFVFANVNAVITNLILKDENGDVLYDQNDAYDAVGTAPTVTAVDDLVLSSDRTEVTVSWSGDTPEDDGAYVVELSTDGGETYSTLANNVTDKKYTVDVEESGTYQFRVYGICGDETTTTVESTSIEVLMPLSDPDVTIESGDGVLTLSWNSIGEATSYEIYRMSSEETDYFLIAEVTELTYADTDVVNETPYYYYVVAISADNSGNGSEVVLSVPSAGHIGEYVYEDEATDIIITKKSYDTVYSNTATLQGVVSNSGSMKLVVNNDEYNVVDLEAKGTFDLSVPLAEGRNDVNLYFTDKEGNITKKTFNFVYLTNYNIIVDDDYTGEDGAESQDNTDIKVFSTVQAAVDSVPSDNQDRVVILIKEGNYVEHLRVYSPYISLIGEDRDMVNISFYDPIESPEGGSTTDRNAVYIKSTATGFSAENLTFENTYEYLGDGTKSNESADALRVDADESTFVNVKLLGYQDTLYASSNHQYYYKNYILGNVDFIYGAAQALFDDSDIVFRYNSNKNSGYVTAPKTDESDDYGYIFNNSRITAEDGCSGSKYLLARPWGPDAAATFVNTYMSDIINAETPYADMSGNLAEDARFYEYYTYGGGFAIHSGRPQISKSQAENMLTTSSLGWNPYTAIIEISENAYVGDIVTEEDEKFVETEYVDDSADPDSTDDTGLGKYSLEGYALAQDVTGGGLLLETSENYYKVETAEEFLNALSTAKSTGNPSVVELTYDIALGSIEIGDAITEYSSIIESDNNEPLLHPTLLETGVSSLDIEGMSNLTIFSQNGAKITHTTINISNSSNIIIRNIVFDELWEWDEDTSGDYDRNDWDYITIQEGSTGVWIDHCTFYKAYDGVIDVKKAESSDTMDVTISWSKFLPESEGSFFDDMMDLLEANPEQYEYYNELMTNHNMTKDQIRQYSAAQKKTHLIGASDTEDNISNLRLTLANNYYKNSMDRMPRVRGGYAHVYNAIMDASDLYELKNSLTDAEAAEKIVSNGAISTCGASVLVENSNISGVIKAILSGNGSSPGGYINAINSVYYMDGIEEELTITDYAGSGLYLDADEFINALPYSGYQLYDAKSLGTLVLPYVGAGNISMSTVQWEKTAYNDVDDSDNEEDTTAPEWNQGELTATEITKTGLKLTWSGASDNAGVESYRVYKDSELLCTVSDEVYNVTGLTANTEYSFNVEAGDSEGNWSTNGPSVTVTTKRKTSSSSDDSSSEDDDNSKNNTTQKDDESKIAVDKNTGTATVNVKSRRDSSKDEVIATVDAQSLNDAFEQTAENENGIKTIYIDIGQVNDGSKVITKLPSEVLTSTPDRVIGIKSSVGSVVLSGNMFNSEEIESGSSIGISLQTVRPETINSSINAGVIVDLDITVNGIEKEWKNTYAPIKLTIPYTPTEEELKQPEKITVIFIQEEPYTEVPVSNAKFIFDEGSTAAGKVVFETTHNSYYAVKYVQKTFDDLYEYEWAKNEIEVLASKGIIKGTSQTTFNPEQSITRADFLQLLISTLGLSANVDENFSDVRESDYYYEAVGIARQLGITNGVGNNMFNPKAKITRQEMMTLSARAMIEAKKLALENNIVEFEKFTDREDIAQYAEKYMAQMVEEGIIKGYGNTLNPVGYATRAETAVIMYRIYNK